MFGEIKRKRFYFIANLRKSQIQIIVDLEKYNENKCFTKRQELAIASSLFVFIPKHRPLKELRGRHVVSIQFFVLE